MDIGLMPLVDDTFQRGKCGPKLLQYMAAGLPTVASPVGVNEVIRIPGETGFLASTDDEWAVALKTLLRSDNLRKRMGRAGRQRCEERYSIRAWLPVLLETLDRVRSGA